MRLALRIETAPVFQHRAFHRASFSPLPGADNARAAADRFLPLYEISLTGGVFK